VYDGFAGLPEKYLTRFADEYKSLVNLPLRLRIIPALSTEKKAAYLKKANTLVGVLGIQSGGRVNRKIFHRHAPAARVIQAATKLKKYDIVGQYAIAGQSDSRRYVDNRT
jgi:hypothetical protein